MVIDLVHASLVHAHLCSARRDRRCGNLRWRLGLPRAAFRPTASIRRLRRRCPYAIEFRGPVRGISEGTEVQFNGIRVGQIGRIGLDADQPDVVMIDVKVKAGTPVRAKGQRAMYLKDARWLTDSPELFGTAIRAHFERRVPALLLTATRDPAGAKLLLRLAVEHFEAVYPPALEEAAPVVRIEGEARLYRVGDGGLIAVQRFVCEVPAHGNRLGPIVDAFAEATRLFAERLATRAQTEVAAPR